MLTKGDGDAVGEVVHGCPAGQKKNEAVAVEVVHGCPAGQKKAAGAAAAAAAAAAAEQSANPESISACTCMHRTCRKCSLRLHRPFVRRPEQILT